MITSMLNLVSAPKQDVLPVVNDAPGGSWAMPIQASNFAKGTDDLYIFIFVLCLISFVGVIGAMAWFMAKYKRRHPGQKTSSITHNGKVEFLWSAIPAVLLVIVFLWAQIDWMKQAVPPDDAIDIRITGRKWYWTVDYPGYPGVQLTSNVNEPAVTMIVPKGRPVRLTMTSEDVIHSFYVPVFRLKRDAVPGRYTNLWFEATRVGTYNVYCAEYCGDMHSKMIGQVKVLEPADFEAALAEAGKLEQKEIESLAEFGQRIYERKGCNACHSLTGEKLTGPSWQGIYGRTETLQDGSSVTVEDNYIRQSILEPNSQVVAGYAPQMPSFAGQFDDKQIAALIEFMKTLK